MDEAFADQSMWCPRHDAMTLHRMNPETNLWSCVACSGSVADMASAWTPLCGRHGIPKHRRPGLGAPEYVCMACETERVGDAVIRARMTGRGASSEPVMPDAGSPLVQAAFGAHETFLSLMVAGFTEEQALRVVAIIIAEGVDR